MRPRILNIKHLLPDQTGVSVMRPSVFGNPFRIGRDGTRDQVCDQFEEYVLQHPDLITRAKRELKGKNLICCCKLKSKEIRCHADTWLRIVNEVSEDDM